MSNVSICRECKIKCVLRPPYVWCGIYWPIGTSLRWRLRERYNKRLSPNDLSFCYPLLRNRQWQACSLKLDHASVNGGHRERYGRELIEAFKMNAATENIAASSILPTRHELVRVFNTRAHTYSFICHSHVHIYVYTRSLFSLY